MSKKFSLLLSLAVIALSSVAYAGPININTADAETLAMELKGVGSALAAAIVEDRQKNGRYATADDLTRVSGIGQRLVENNREYILVNDPAESSS